MFGIKWDPTGDNFSFSVQINLTKKVKGVRTGDNLTQETLPKILTADLTRRIILGIVNTCQDPLGLLSPITVQLNLHMRDLFSKDAGLDWDTPLPPELKQEWLSLF